MRLSHRGRNSHHFEGQFGRPHTPKSGEFLPKRPSWTNQSRTVMSDPVGSRDQI